MRLRALLFNFFLFFAFFGAILPVLGADSAKISGNAPVVSFFHPTGMNGFIVYDVDPGEDQAALSYGSKSFDLSSPLGLPVTVEVEGFNISEGNVDFQQILQDTGSNYLEIFSIQRALNYGAKSSLSPQNAGPSDITMVVASANYQATDRFSAKLATGFSQAVKDQNDSASALGYELDIAGLYKIAPGLTFSVGAGYATNLDHFNSPVQNETGKGFWSLTSKLRLKF